MRHLGTVPLHTARLTLRRHEVSDAAQMYAHWANDPEVTRYLTWLPHKSVDETTVLLREWVADYAQSDVYQWGIVLNATGELIGSISVVDANERSGAVEIGYCLGHVWWGQGIMTEALARVIDFFFDEVGANRVWSCHDVANPASGAVMRKCGMLFEGIERAGILNNQGKPVDTLRYAIVVGDRQQQTQTKRGRRIATAEACLARVTHANRLLALAKEEHERSRGDYEALSAYYGSPAWREDLAADEAGQLSADLRRGVLSEDAAYDALTEYEAL